MDKIIEVSRIEFTYGERRILDDISFDVKAGSFVSIIGPNGSGKTTLLKNISGVLRPDMGNIVVNGRDVERYKKNELAKLMAFVPQSTVVDFGFTVMDIVMMGRSPYLGPFDSETMDDIRIVEEAMELVNISKLKDKKINEVSGGERQRAAIACALAQSPKIILMDEPVSNLDLKHQIDVLDIVKKLCTERGMTAVVVLHDLNLASEYSDSILLLKDGKLECSGSPTEVITEDNIKRLYNVGVYMMKNPISGRPYTIPLTRMVKE